MASYSVTSETCEKDLGINKKVTNFGLPIGFVAYMPAISVYYLIILFYGLEQYGMACFAVLLSQMSVPAGTIAYALAMIHITHKKRRV